MTDQSYSLSFTASSLRTQESLKIAALYMRYHDWDAVHDDVIANNILQQRTTSSAKRIYQELVARLQHLSDAELDYFVNAPDSDRSLLLWGAICRHYRFVHDFAVEVLHEHRRNLNFQIQYADFDAFFNTKLSIHEELSAITESTRRKLRQVVFRMLREAGLAAKDNSINAVVPSPAMSSLMEKHDPEFNSLF